MNDLFANRKVRWLIGLTTVCAAFGLTRPAGKPIIGSDDLELFTVELGPDLKGKVADYVETRIVPVERMPFSKAFRLRTIGYPENADDIKLTAVVPKPIADCDRLLLTFYARGLRTVRDEAGAGIQIQVKRVKFNQALNLFHEMRIGVKDEWTKVYLPFTSSGDWEPNADPAKLIFCLGFPEQTIEIGGIEVVDFGTAFDITTLPHPEKSYAGREGDAPWRKAADERIEKIRKGDLTIQVTDAQGRPAAGVEVSVTQKEHAFPFGHKVDELIVMQDERYLKGYKVSREDCRKYREAWLDLGFNTGSVNYCLSWPVFEWYHDADPKNRGRRKSEMGLQTVEWLKEHGKRALGTQIIWPQYIPKDIQGFDDAEQLKKRARTYLVDVIQAVPENEGWIVFNESAWDQGDPQSYPDRFFGRVGREFMVECYRLARRTNPRAKLLLNDGRIVTWGGMETGKQQAVENQIRYLLDQGAPLDGLGIESHFVNSIMTPPERVLEIFDRYASLVKEIWITEYDNDTVDEQLQADYLRDYLTLCFSHPAVQGFIHWSLWDGRNYIPGVAFFRKDWTPRPTVNVWKDLVLRQWRTNVSGKTDEAGRYTVRGFLGDYEITVTHEGKTQRSRTSISREPTVTEIVME